MEEELKKSVQENGLEQDVIFYGFQPPERVRDVMERCHVHLFTSNYLEGMGRCDQRGDEQRMLRCEQCRDRSCAVPDQRR